MKMKKKHSFIAVAALALMATACSNEENGGANEAAKYITVSPTIGQMTRVTSDSPQAFEAGDQISVFAWTGTAESVNTDDLIVNGSINTLSSDLSAWTAEPQMLWKNTTDAHYFLSVYPSRSIADFTADQYTLDVADQEKSDLLVATNLTGLTATNNPVSLTFNHAMAKLIVNLSFRNQWGTDDNGDSVSPTVTSVNATAMTAATVDYVTATGTVVTATGEQGAVSLPATTANTQYTSIMVPQTGFNTIAIVIDGKTYTFTHTADIPLESGKYTTVSLIVGRNQIDLGTVSISDWTEGETITGGEAQTD